MHKEHPSGSRHGDVIAKPAGGFISVKVEQLLCVWWGYQAGHISLFDFRVWFGAQLEVARRCRLKKDAPRHFKVADLRAHVGAVGECSVRASLRRLERIGLLRWREDGISFVSSVRSILVDDVSTLEELINEVGTPRRPVALPRRLVKLLAKGQVCDRTGAHHQLSKARLATLLAHLIRCVHWKKSRGITNEGLCKVSWVVEVFGVCRRAVIAARLFLERLGWMRRHHRPQQFLNRYGSSIEVNLEWVGGELSTGESAPPCSQSTTECAPPYRNQNPPTDDLKTRTGVGFASQTGFSKPKTGNKKLRVPTWKHLVEEDLEDTGRLLDLFERACEKGIVGGSEFERLSFLGAAERARRKGSTNRLGLFVELVRKKLWNFITLEDEDGARDRLRKHLYGDFERCELEEPSLAVVA